jgi:transposase
MIPYPCGKTGKGMSDIRINRADRRQPAFELVDLDALVPHDHRVRNVWAFVMSLDLSEFYARIKARGSAPGRPATDAAIVLALWLYATMDAIGSARLLARRCEYDVIYRWICGGVEVNHNILSEFRVDNGTFLDRLMTSTLTALIEEGLVCLEEVLTDGTKVRASASRTSMRRKPRMQEIETEVAARLATLKREIEEDPSVAEDRQKRRQYAIAKDRAERVGAALKKYDEREKALSERAQKHPKTPAEAPRVSLSDPDARSMRMADGAKRPCYNVQVATANGFVVAIEPTERCNDTGLAPDTVKEVEQRCAASPDRLLADNGSMTQKDIVDFAKTYPAMQVYSPPKTRAPNATAKSRARYDRNLAKQPDCLKQWRARMESADGREIYSRRGMTEHAHARMKNCGFERMPVRGLKKVRSVCRLHAIAHNLSLAFNRRANKAA